MIDVQKEAVVTNLLSGKLVADKLAENILTELKKFSSPIKMVTVGFPDPQWLQYTNSLKKTGELLGVLVENVLLGRDASLAYAIDLLKKIRQMPDVCGVLPQQPLKGELATLCDYIPIDKDIDCVSFENRARLFLNSDVGVFPATPLAVLNLLDFYNIDLLGKHVVVVGRGMVGKPLAQMLLRRNATVTVCHSKTTNLASLTRAADIVVSACGVPGVINKNCIAENSVVVDVGLSFCNGKACGDVAEEVYSIANACSPVPGGVGPVTRMTLFTNLVAAANRQRK